MEGICFDDFPLQETSTFPLYYSKKKKNQYDLQKNYKKEFELFLKETNKDDQKREHCPLKRKKFF